MEFNFTLADVLLLMPAIMLFLFSLVPLTLKVLRGNQEPNSFATMIYGLAGTIAAGGWLIGLGRAERVAFSGSLVFDGIAVVMGMVVIFVTAFALIYSRENFATNNKHYSEFVFLLLNSAAGMLFVMWSNDLIFFFVGIELMSLCLYVMIALSSEERFAKEAAFKYFVLGSFASAILLYGIAFVFGTVGSTQLGAIGELAPSLLATNRLFLVGLVFLTIGICFKVSIFPMHAWTPDVYQGSPTPITAFMATGVKAATFVLFLRLIKTDAWAAEQSASFVQVLQWLAALTMLVGNIAAVMQSNLKRMLAYSSVAHSGYIMIGVLVAGLLGQEQLGSSSVLFYLVSYSLMTMGAFGVISLLEAHEHTRLQVEDLSGLAKRSPWLALCLTLFLLSLAGVPPAIGFFAKFFIFSAAIKAKLFWLVIWGVVSSIVSVYYYLRPIVYMYMKEEEGVAVPEERGLSLGVVSFSAGLVLILGIVSYPLYKTVVAALG